jgi:peptidoglycan hydrolase-like protein with peptidoglycan-binding domain
MRLSRSLLPAAVAALLCSAGYAANNVFVDAVTVRDVQHTLNSRGLRVAIDGVMGPRTRDAIRQFQKSENLDPTGQLNRQTLIALGIQQPDVRAEEARYSTEIVRSVQQTLNNRGFRAGTVDGLLNAGTRTALRDFQKSENLEETGQLNQQTLSALGIPLQRPIIGSAQSRIDREHGGNWRATVRDAQRRLANLGYHMGPVDGVLGPSTRAALSDFQRDRNLPVTGRIDRDTFAVLHTGEPVASR